MVSLNTVVAVAVACGVVAIVIAVVGTIVWVRIRQERLSLAVARAGYRCSGPHGHPPPFNEETLTEISREEGSALRQYGQLPYGRPSEWGLLASQESLYRSRHESDSSSNLAEKARDLRRSFSWSKTLRPSRSLTRPRQGSSLAPLTESSERHSQFSPVSPLKEPISISAVDGALELPTETTPRQTPERDGEGGMSNPDPTTTYPTSVFPLLRQHERPSGLFPLIEVSHEATGRVRGGSITTQTAGIMPEHPVPPPPCAYPPNRFRLSKNDSMCFSSLSLETADSSILDESRSNYAAMEHDFTSPHLPPCPTFAPYSANDVGRTEYDRRSFLAPNAAPPPPFLFPATSPAKEGRRLEPDRTSPRRSLTTHSPTQSMDRISPPPRRSESLSAHSHPKRDTSSMPYIDFNRIPPLNAVGQNAALVPHFSQLQRHSMYGGPPRDVDPFYGGGYTAPSTLRRPDNLLHPESAVPVSYGHLRAPLPSALKGGSGPRKGHRRQNCVRISIHPPITFGGPAFSPMVEEPEDVDEFDMSRSEVPELATPNLALNSTAFPPGRKSYQGTPKGQQTAESTSSPGRTRKHKRGTSTDSTIDMTMAAAAPEKEKVLPEIQTTILPTTEVTHLPQTPSPDKSAPAWTVSNPSGSPTGHENTFGPRSSRRSIVKGPRSQPTKSPAQRNSTRSSGPLEESTQYTGTAGSPPAQSSRSHSTRREQQPRMSTGSLQRTRSNAPSPSSLRERSTSEPSDYLEKSTQTAQQQASQQLQPDNPQHPKITSSPNSKTNTNSHNNNSNIIVPIWEDKKSPARKPPTNPFQTDEPVELPDTSPRRPPQRTKSRASASASQKRKPRRSSRQDFTTPTKRAIGLGIGAATPGSLYDGDGFLKE